MSEFVNRLNKMTVPELWYELNTQPHTIVDQYIIKEIIKKKYQQELICQAKKNFDKMNKPDNVDGCTVGKNPNQIIKDNDNLNCMSDCSEVKTQIIFDASDFQRSEPNKLDMIDDDTNYQLNNRFMEDIKTVNSIHKKTKQKPVIQSPYI
jgi:hypothetical protein